MMSSLVMESVSGGWWETLIQFWHNCFKHFSVSRNLRDQQSAGAAGLEAEEQNEAEGPQRGTDSHAKAGTPTHCGPTHVHLLHSCGVLSLWFSPFGDCANWFVNLFHKSSFFKDVFGKCKNEFRTFCVVVLGYNNNWLCHIAQPWILCMWTQI